MNLFELFVKIGVDDQASGKLKDLGGKLGNGLATAAKIGTAAVTAAAAGITALTKAAVNNYAEYEQLVGGVETLFKGSADKVQEYAANAYKTAGMSANEYMSTVTSFSASLLQSLGGDTDKAAEYANQALTDMSDNANKMGTSMEMIQNAYQGFAKQNYTMLDNLKLGYGGTKEEIARLIEDAAKLSDTVDAQDMSFANIVKAINVVQTEMGITGTTAKEAGSTIQGSVGMMKSAWQNLVTGIADENANLDVLLTNLVDSVGTVAENLIPKIEVALGSIASLIEKIAPVIVESLPSLVSSVVPSLVSAATGMVNAVIAVLPDLLNTVVDAIIDNAPTLIDSAIVLIGELSNGILSQLPQIVQLGLDLIVSLANGISQNIGTLIPTIIDVVLQIVDTLTNPSTLVSLIDAGIQLILGLVTGLVDAIPKIIEAIPQIIENIITALIDSIPLIIEAGIELFVSLVKNLPAIIAGIIMAIPKIIASILEGLGELGGMLADLFSEAWEGIKNVFSSVGSWFKEKFTEGKEKAQESWANAKEGFKIIWGKTKEAFADVGSWFSEKFTDAKNRSTAAWSNAKNIFSQVWAKVKSGFSISDALTWGKDMLDNFINGIKAKWNKLVDTVKQTAQKVKNFLGFSEPKEGPLSNFHTYAPDMMNLFAKGIRDNEDVVINQVKKSFDLRKHIGVIEPEVSGIANIGSYGGYGGTTTEKSVSVVQNIYSEAKSAADLMQEALYFQERSVMLGV